MSNHEPMGIYFHPSVALPRSMKTRNDIGRFEISTYSYRDDFTEFREIGSLNKWGLGPGFIRVVDINCDHFAEEVHCLHALFPLSNP